MDGDEKTDEDNGHVVVAFVPDSGPCRWKCTLCGARSADREFFRKYVCDGQPDAVGGG